MPRLLTLCLILQLCMPGLARADQELFWAETTRAVGYLVDGKLIDAVAAAARARAANPVPELDALVGLAALADGRASEALKLLRLAAKHESIEPLVFYWGARAALAAGDERAALKQITRAIAVGGDQPAFRMAQAILLKEAGKRAEALAALALVAGVTPNLLDPSLYPSPAQGAVDLLGPMLRRFPHADQLSRTQAHLAWRAGRSLAAYRRFQTLASRMPADPGVKQMLAQAQAMVGLEKQAMITAEEAVALAPEAADALATLGELRLAAGDAVRAAAHLKKAADGRPADAPLLLKLAQACQEAEDPDCAQRFYGYALRRNPKLAAAHFGLALLTRSKKEPQKTWQYFARAMVLDPGNVRYYRAAANFLYLQKEKKRAAALLRKARRAARLEREMDRSVALNHKATVNMMTFLIALKADAACQGACAKLLNKLPGMARRFAGAHLKLTATPSRSANSALAPLLGRLSSKKLLRTDPTILERSGKTFDKKTYVIKRSYPLVPQESFR